MAEKPSSHTCSGAGKLKVTGQRLLTIHTCTCTPRPANTYTHARAVMWLRVGLQLVVEE